MGILGKMFEKKNCDVCGEEIKLLGNRKLEDGNLCKNCANKLFHVSPLLVSAL
jgi:formylmethanofuran dehydrogenase subunit E